MKSKTVFLGLMLAFCLVFCLQGEAFSIEELILQLRPDYFQLNNWLSQATVTTVMTPPTTTTTTLPSFTLGNRTITYNLSWCMNLTQLGLDQYAFLYEGHKVELNATTVGIILNADLLAQNCTRVIRTRVDADFIVVCNNSNPLHVWGVNCKYATAKCISYGDGCLSKTGFMPGCMTP